MKNKTSGIFCNYIFYPYFHIICLTNFNRFDELL